MGWYSHPGGESFNAVCGMVLEKGLGAMGAAGKKAQEIEGERPRNP